MAAEEDLDGVPEVDVGEPVTTEPGTLEALVVKEADLEADLVVLVNVWLLPLPVELDEDGKVT